LDATTELLLRFTESLGLLVVLIFGVGFAFEYLGPRWPRALPVVNGLLFGALAVLFMNLPMQLEPGLIFDLRNLVVFLAGPFGGPLAAGIAGSLAGAYRLYLGGAGAFSGFGGILTAAAFGALVGWRYGRLDGWKPALLAGLGLFVFCMPWFLAVGDLAHGWSLIERFALPYAVFYIGGTMVISGLFMAFWRHRAAERLAELNEQRFRDLAEVASDWFWEMDENLKMTYVSHRLREITGFSAEEFKGKTRRQLVAHVAPSALKKHEETLQRHEAFRNFRYTIRTADGKGCQVLTSGKPIFGEKGEFLGYRGSGRDVSQAARQKQELEAAKLNAELANKAKSDFLASMSHELRTPLNAIIGFAEIMEKEILGKHSVSAYRGYASDIRSSADYLLSLVNDVLDVARVEAGHLEINKEACDLKEVAETALRLLNGRARKQGLQLIAEIQEDLPPAFADERAMKQAIVNLLTNAVKFTRPGGRVTLAVTHSAEAGHRISVSDTGVGIAPEDVEAVLNPFHQAANTRLMTRDGTGLGLTLTKALIEAHGGRLELSSRLGEGTQVDLWLPPSSEQSAPADVTPKARLQGR
jgi:PAS domain S-box-containing protein